MWNNTPRQLTAQDRLNICVRCPYVKQAPVVGLTCGTLLKPEYDRNGRQLTCGCILKAKTALSGQSCPQNKW
jgi:hypothetical protein